MSNSFGLPSSTISDLKKVFKKYSSIKKAIIYGSRATGKHKLGSDIDITLIAPDADLTLLLKIENEIDDLLMPYKLDLSLFNHIEDEALRARIDEHGKSFYEA